MRTIVSIICLSLLPSLLIFGLSQNGLLNNIELRLMNIIVSSEKLEEESKISKQISLEKKQRVEKILTELGGLKTRLKVSVNLMTKYRHRVTELLGTINRLEAKLRKLSVSYENTVKPLQEALDLAEVEIRVQKVKTVIWSIVAGVLGVAAGLSLSVIF